MFKTSIFWPSERKWRSSSARCHTDNVEVNPFTQASIAKPELQNTNCSFRQKGPHGPMCRRQKLGARTQHCSLLTECGVLASIAPYTLISHTKMSIFFHNGRSSNYILESQAGKLMVKTFSRDTHVHVTTEPIMVPTKNRHSITAWGFCCYYLEHCCKTNHIAIKRTKFIMKTFLDS